MFPYKTKKYMVTKYQIREKKNIATYIIMHDKEDSKLKGKKKKEKRRDKTERKTLVTYRIMVE